MQKYINTTTVALQQRHIVSIYIIFFLLYTLHKYLMYGYRGAEQ